VDRERQGGGQCNSDPDAARRRERGSSADPREDRGERTRRARNGAGGARDLRGIAETGDGGTTGDSKNADSRRYYGSRPPGPGDPAGDRIGLQARLGRNIPARRTKDCRPPDRTALRSGSFVGEGTTRGTVASRSRRDRVASAGCA